MINQLTQSEFTAAFHNMNRGDQFSHTGLIALYDYLTELEEDCGMQIELDVIAICCDYVEYDDLNECLSEYSNVVGNLNSLRDHTTVIELDNGGVIIQAF